MSVRNGLLAILSAQPAHGYALKSDFERGTAGTWPLNIGQVYSTLARLERDGLIAPQPTTSDTTRQTWRITEAGLAELRAWFAQPVLDDPPPRDEFTIKVLLAVAADRDDVQSILDRQRAATLTRLQELTRQKLKADPRRELVWILLVDALILRAEAELKWIALCEARLRDRGLR